jgi:hypothetical protein
MLWIHGVQTWSLENGCIFHADNEVGGSTINSSKKKTLKVRINRELKRPLWRLYIVIKNMFQ